MKAFAISPEGQLVELVFANPDEADAVFSKAMKQSRGIGIVVDKSGKHHNIDLSYGYSDRKSDFDRIKIYQ